MKEALLASTRSLLLTVLILSSSVVPALAYFHPDEGRWISRDPAEEQGGVNPLAFVANNTINKIDVLGLWQKAETIDNDKRRVYVKEDGDTWVSLSQKVGLRLDERLKWGQPYQSQQDPSSGVAPCKVSVPNVWISADIMSGGTAWSQFVSLGGSLGQFFGTDLGTYGFKIEQPATIMQLASALGNNQGNIWGMVVFGHGNKEGLLSTSTTPQQQNHGIDWIYQQELTPYVDFNGYHLAKIYMMQCYSAYSGSVQLSNGTTLNVDFNNMWQQRAVYFFGYSGMNILGIAMPF